MSDALNGGVSPLGGFRGQEFPRHYFGGSGPTRKKDAGRGARAFDALLRRAVLRGEVPE